MFNVDHLDSRTPGGCWTLFHCLIPKYNFHTNCEKVCRIDIADASIFTNCYCQMSMLSLNAIHKFHGFQLNTTKSAVPFSHSFRPFISSTAFAFAFISFGSFVKGKLNFQRISLSRNDGYILTKRTSLISTWFGSSLRKCLQAIKVFRFHHFHSSFFFYCFNLDLVSGSFCYLIQ